MDLVCLVHMLEAVVMVGGQYLTMAALVLMLGAVAMLGGQYLPMAVGVGRAVVVWLRGQDKLNLKGS